MKVLSRRFSGYASGDDYLANAVELVNDATANGEKFRADTYYTAGYDSPFVIFNRTNEVWFETY